MVASKRLSGTHVDHTVPIPDSDERVLRTAIVYGANGAGKSNLIRALEYFASLAVEPRNRHAGTGRVGFRLTGSPDLSSSFDLHFIAGSRLFRLGMKVSDASIEEEWLVQVKGGEEIEIYERTTSPEGNVTVRLNQTTEAGAKLSAMATVGGPAHQSFLATVRATLDSSEWGAELRNVVEWFRDFVPIAPSSEHSSLAGELARHPELVQFAGEFLRDASTGVDHLEVLREEVSKDTFLSLVPSPFLGKVPDELPGGKAFHLRLNDDTALQMEGSNGDTRFYRIKLQAVHGLPNHSAVYLDLSEESDGTKRLLELLPVLHYLQSGSGVVVIDELERSMHPNLVRKFLRCFLSSATAQGQIIATTHQADLLDLGLLRRDEIWFVEKDGQGASHLYSLADFKERDQQRIREHYLQGRFGAIPAPADPDRLTTQTNESHSA